MATVTISKIRVRRFTAVAVLAMGLGVICLVPTVAQQAYMSGQSISPAYEGWEQNDDGSFDLVFGYMNRNWKQVVDVPIGPDNSIEPGGADQGQPTHFYPRRNRFTFRVRVPADFGDKELVWRLTANGYTERAYGTLKRDYFMDDFVVQANYGAGGAAATTPELVDNEAPVLTIDGPSNQTTRVGEPINLVAFSSDDGKPRARSMRASSPRFPGRITTDSSTGHRLAWYVYRGAGNVTFDPPQTKTWEDTRDGGNSPWSPGWQRPEVPEDGRWKVAVTFSEPGTYVLRAIAHDGGLATIDDAMVVVSP